MKKQILAALTVATLAGPTVACAQSYRIPTGTPAGYHNYQRSKVTILPLVYRPRHRS